LTEGANAEKWQPNFKNPVLNHIPYHAALPKITMKVFQHELLTISFTMTKTSPWNHGISVGLKA